MSCLASSSTSDACSMHIFSEAEIVVKEKGNGGEVRLKEWECVQVGHHKNGGKTVEEWQKNGWRLHTYQATGPYMGEINNYLLFERGE